jgi:purine nucleosidase/pyrimidine-specific ribonucleoside hydrolase
MIPGIPPRRVIIDTDPGADDALALLLALNSPELEVVGITTTCGNVPVGQATRNLLRVLSLVKVPPALLVGQGAARPLEEDLITATHFHGVDGLGDLDRFVEPGGARRYPQPVIPATLPTSQEVWNDCVRRYPSSLTLIVLGPLTNLAVALRVNPTLVQRFESIIVMGGAMGVTGNISPAAEFNIYVDPHAAARVLQASLPTTLIPLDVTTKVKADRKRLAEWASGSCDPVARFVVDATGRAFDFAEKMEGHGELFFHDPVAVLAAIDASLFVIEPLHVEVETVGLVARGVTIADRRTLKAEQKRSPNVLVAVDVDVPRATDLIRSRLCRKS